MEEIQNVLQNFKEFPILQCCRMGHTDDIKFLCADNRCGQGRNLEPHCSTCPKDQTNPHYQQNHKSIGFPDALIELTQSLYEEKKENKKEVVNNSGNEVFEAKYDEKCLQGYIKYIQSMMECLRKLQVSIGNFSEVYKRKKNAHNIKDFVSTILGKISFSENHKDLKQNIFDLALISSIQWQKINIQKQYVFETSKQIRKDFVDISARLKKTLETLDKNFGDVRQLMEKELLPYSNSRAEDLLGTFAMASQVRMSVMEQSQPYRNSEISGVLSKVNPISNIKSEDFEDLKHQMRGMKEALEKLALENKKLTDHLKQQSSKKQVQLEAEIVVEKDLGKEEQIQQQIEKIENAAENKNEEND